MRKNTKGLRELKKKIIKKYFDIFPVFKMTPELINDLEKEGIRAIDRQQQILISLNNIFYDLKLNQSNKRIIK